MYYMTYFFYLVNLRACFDFFKNGKGVGCSKHRVTGQPFNISLMYNLVLWNNFFVKKITFEILLFAHLTLNQNDHFNKLFKIS